MADDTDIQQICGICHRQFARYTCPRCNLRYCSLHCYKAETHLKCTESFYKESIQNEIHAKGTTQADRRNMMAMLQRFELEAAAREEGGGDSSSAGTSLDLPENTADDSSDDGAISSLDERLKNFDLENASTDQILSMLTVEERELFEKSLLQNSQVDAEVPLWQPWWNIEDRKIGKGNDGRPSLHVEVVDFATLTSNPHPTLPYNLLNLLYVYAFVGRSMNGDIHENAYEAWKMISQIGSVFDASPSAHLNSCKAAIEDVISRSNNIAIFSQPSALHELLINDMRSILREPQDVIAAVCDLHVLLASLKRDKKAELAAKKMIYYLSFAKWWSEESSITLVRQLIARTVLLKELVNYQSERMAYDAQFETAKAQMEHIRASSTTDGKSAPQIQELE